MWAITATLQTARGEYRGHVEVPTFYLDERVQGITSRSMAKRIAADILATANPALILNVNMWITAERVDNA
jgi:hypothetical protein